MKQTEKIHEVSKTSDVCISCKALYSAVFSVLMLFACSQKQPEEQEAKKTTNPLLRQSNEIVAFSRLTPENISETEVITVKNADEQLQAILAVKGRTFENTLMAFDRLFNSIARVVLPLDLIIETNPDEGIRNSGRQSQGILRNYLFRLETNGDLYKAIEEYSKTKEAEALSGHRKKFMDNLLLKFRKSGLALPLEQRDKIMQLKAKIETLGKEFSSNIAASSSNFIEITEADTAGLERSYLDARKTEKGTYIIDMSYPSMIPFMNYSKSDKLRKELFTKYNNRAYPVNVELLDSILLYRHELATMLGYRSFAEYDFGDKMVKTPAAVWEFLNSMTLKLKEKNTLDNEKLLKTKSKYTGLPSKKIEMWEKSFYTEILKETEYKLDDRKLREYFVMDNVIEGLFKITQELLGLRYQEVEVPDVWHPDVRMFNCYDTKSDMLIGRFYLDLFPRENKYSHAAMFTITGGLLMEDGSREISEAALVCNFPKPEGGNPSLLFHNDVETFFHEFGHLLHALVTKAELAYQSGPENVVLDFVEAPSQIYENWAWQKQTLALFAKHYQTGEMIPDELLDKMIAGKHLNSGIDALRQIFYAAYALYLHDKFVPGIKETTTEIGKKLQKEMTGFDLPENTYFQASFGHLTGYAAGYYSYMWSKVYAQDMWSVFEEQGAMNPELGSQYRQKVLEPAGSRDALDLVRDFLGREPDNKALMKELGLEHSIFPP